jgi:hypothetical protein
MTATAAVFLLISCTSESNTNLPGYSGSFDEVIVLMPTQDWNSSTGDAVYGVLAAPLKGLPADEPSLTVIHVADNKFQSILRTHRNIFIPEVSREKYAFAPPNLIVERSIWARGQFVVRLTAPNSDSLIAGLGRYGNKIQRLFNDIELNRRIMRNKEYGATAVNDSVRKAMKMDMIFQKDFAPLQYREGVLWLRLDRERPQGGYKHPVNQGVLLFNLPYSSKAQLLDTFIMNATDSILTVHIQGTVPGSHMIIDRVNVTPVNKEINQFGRYGREIRGIWRMEKNYFGGPFYLLAVLDESRQRVMYAFTYVYAPQFEKRDYLREVEAIARTLKPVEP